MSKKRPLEIACSSTKCGKEIRPAERRHSFTSPISGIPGVAGTCRSCGADLIDWEFCHALDSAGLDRIVGEFRQELIRDNYWGAPLPEAILRKARKRTAEQLKRTIDLNMHRALVPDHPRERRQTPFAYSDTATLITCAQHATGTCCRTCLEK